MTKKIRLSILFICIICFLTITPFLVAYSMGYRFDFEKNKVVSTGGVYVRTFPAAEQIIIDSKTYSKPGIFSNSVFIQSLLPKNHTIYIQKDGYYNYFKTLPVQERTVTKLENITLFKKSLQFNLISDNTDYFSIAPNNQNAITINTDKNTTIINYFNLNSNSISQSQKIIIPEIGKVSDVKWAGNSEAALIKIQSTGKISYYFLDGSLAKPTAELLPYLDKNSDQIFFNPRDNQEIFYEENQILYSLKNKEPELIIKNLITYSFYRNNILWLSSDGGLYQSDTLGNFIDAVSSKSLSPDFNKQYRMAIISDKIFLQESNPLLMFNLETKIFENIFDTDGNYKIISSPDSKNLIFCSKENIYVYPIIEKDEQHKLYSGEKIENCQWLNNDYIILSDKSQIIISEIDYRGNINTVVLPSSIQLEQNKTLALNNPKTFYINQSGKLYILTDRTFIASEKLTP